MHITLRSHLILGTAAAVGASAIAMTPAIPISLPSIPSPVAAQVALADFDSPLAQLFATLDQTNNYLLDAQSDVRSAANWPYANFGTTFGTPPTNYPLLPTALGQDQLGGYTSVGLVAQFIDDALPIIRQLGFNGLSYLNNTGNAVFQSASELTQAVWTAAGQALSGNISGAVTTISDAVNFAGTYLLGVGQYILANVVTKATAVVNTLTGALPQLLTATAAQAAVVVASASAVITNTVTALSLGNIQGAWNAAVDGLLGPSGIPGTLLNLTIGAGVQTGPIATPDVAGISAVFVPSVRTEVQALVKAIAADLAAVPAAPAATKTARSVAAARPAAAAKSAAPRAPRAAKRAAAAR